MDNNSPIPRANTSQVTRIAKRKIRHGIFIPFKILDVIRNTIGERHKKQIQEASCNKNLVDLHTKQISLTYTSDRLYKWIYKYSSALRRAVYSHDWDKLLYLLKAAPIWEQYSMSGKYYSIDNYLRAYTILLLNHPAAKTQESLMNFFHLVLACRTESDKKALLKLLLTLPHRLTNRNSFIRNAEANELSLGIIENDDDVEQISIIDT